MCSIFDVKITSKMCKLFEFLKNYDNCFDFKNAKTLFKHENENYIIDLIFDAKSLYESLYTFSEIKFNVLRNYLLKNLTLNYIQEFMSRMNISMLFIFKKNDNFRLCIDYRKLNAFIVKNKCSFLLFNRTLNCFMSAIYFIKLDFKNAYY